MIDDKYATIKKLFEGITVFWLRDLITLFMQVICTVITFRLLNVEEYGRLTLFLSTYGIFSFFVDIGSGSTFISEMANSVGRNQYGEAKYLMVVFLRLATITTLLSIVVLVVIARVGVFPFAVHTNVLLVLCLYMLLTPVWGFYSLIFFSNSQFVYLSLTNIIMTAGRMLFLLAILIISRMKQLDMVFVLFMSYPAALLLSVLVLFLPLRRNLAPILSERQTHAPRMGMVLAQLVGFNSLYTFFRRIQDESPYWVINFLLGKRATGLYGAAIKAYTFFYSFLKAVGTAGFPLIAQVSQDRKLMGILFRKTVQCELWLALIMVIIVWLFSSPIIHILAGSQYHESAMLLKIIIFSLFPYSIFQGLQSIMFALRLQSSLFMVYLTSSFLIITLNIAGLSIFKSVNFSGIALIWDGIAIFLLTLYMLFRRERSIFKELRTDFRKDMFSFKELASVLRIRKK